MPTAIEFNHVSKQYRLGLVSTRTLSHDLQRWWTMNIRGKEDPYLKIGETNDRSTKGSSDYVWALKDIDFKVEQGDVVGIIGKNGAGKSTLLKLLSKVTGPTTGSIKARGRIGALLEVGTGFHPEMTGRENIFLNGAILGMNKHEIASKLDEIVDFSGCERYLDTPVKRYSSGMMVRLGFAVAAHLDPEILVVDEVLAVGDAEFQKKAIGKMQDVSKGEGRTVLFVSHNMGSVRNLCKSGILLENGIIRYSGDVISTINEYQKTTVNAYYTNIVYDSHEKVSLLSIDILNVKEEKVDVILSGQPVKFRLQLLNKKENIQDLKEFTVGIESLFGEVFLILNNININKRVDLEFGINTIDIMIDKFPLASGQYRMGIYLANQDNVLLSIETAKILEIDSSYFYESARFHHKSKYLIDYQMVVNC